MARYRLPVCTGLAYSELYAGRTQSCAKFSRGTLINPISIRCVFPFSFLLRSLMHYDTHVRKPESISRYHGGYLVEGAKRNPEAGS